MAPLNRNNASRTADSSIGVALSTICARRFRIIGFSGCPQPRMVASYCLGWFIRSSHRLVALPMSKTSKPVANGSSVPAWPTLTPRGKSRLTLFTTPGRSNSCWFVDTIKNLNILSARLLKKRLGMHISLPFRIITDDEIRLGATAIASRSKTISGTNTFGLWRNSAIIWDKPRILQKPSSAAIAKELIFPTATLARKQQALLLGGGLSLRLVSRRDRESRHRLCRSDPATSLDQAAHHSASERGKKEGV